MLTIRTTVQIDGAVQGVSEAVAVGRAGVRAIGDIDGTLGGGGGGGGRGAIRSSESAGGPWTIGLLQGGSAETSEAKEQTAFRF